MTNKSGEKPITYDELYEKIKKIIKKLKVKFLKMEI